jgi:hypothetical protein
VQEVVPAGQQLDRGGDRLRGGRRPGAAWAHGTLANARAWRAEAKQAAAAHLRELLPTVLAGQGVIEGLRSLVERRAGRFAGCLPTRGGGT